MAMNATQVALNVKGVNRTGKVFAQIASSAAKVGKTAALFGAAAFSGAAVAIAATAKQLGHLSDVAMQAGMSAKELTQLSSAMGVLGIKSQTPEMLAMAFQRMAKSIGETGVGGFKKAIAAIAEMETVEERSAAAMAVFGKSGLDFMPLIEAAAKDGVGALEEVISSMPMISNEAANAGDAVADAMQIATDGTKALWSEAIGSICEWFDGQFVGGIREAAMRLNAYLEFYVKLFWRSCLATFENIGKAWGALSADWGNTFKAAINVCWDAMKAWVNFVWEQIKNVGVLIRDFGKQLWSFVKGDGFDFDAIFANTNFRETCSNLADEMKESFARNNIFEGVEWSEAEVGDITETLENKLTAAAKGAAAVGKAAVATTAAEAAGDTAEKIGKAVKAMKAEFVDASSYKAATMAIRADYGKGESKTVGAVNAVKKVNEKIAAATEKTAAALADIGGI